MSYSGLLLEPDSVKVSVSNSPEHVSPLFQYEARRLIIFTSEANLLPSQIPGNWNNQV
jgi:hypothetical protein